MKETPYEIFQRSPEEALEDEFQRQAERQRWLNPGKIFVWQGLLGIDRQTRYGSYRLVSRDELTRRKHQIEFWDGQVSIFWLDALHDPKTKQKIPIEVA